MRIMKRRSPGAREGSNFDGLGYFLIAVLAGAVLCAILSVFVVYLLLGVIAATKAWSWKHRLGMSLALNGGLALFVLSVGMVCDARWFKSPLHYAVEKRSPLMGKLALTIGVDIDKDGRGYLGPPLHVAARMGHHDMATFLLGRGARIDNNDPPWGTPLHVAAGEGRLETVRFLLEKGASASMHNVKLGSPLNLAVKRGDPAIVGLLLRSGAAIDELVLRSAAAKSLAMTTIILARKKDANAQALGVMLVSAAWAGNGDVAAELLKRGALIDARGHKGRSPLHGATKSSLSELMKTLIARGADTNARDDENRTPLFYVSRYQSGTAKILLAAGADGTVKDRFGDTPMVWAKKNCAKELVDILRAHGVPESEISGR